MNEELRDLYQEVILDHGKNPRNFRVMNDHDRKIDGFNPLCGDQITLYLKVEDNVVKDVSFQGKGCAISTASASMLTETMKGKTEEDANKIFEQFRKLVTEEGNPDCSCLGKLEVFQNLKEYPMRVKCATLCWHALNSALKGDEEMIIAD